MRKSLPPTPVPTTAEASPARSVDQVVAEGGAVAAASVAQVSGQGPFQLQLFACGVLSTSVMLAHSLAYRLLARPARHWCAPPEGDLTLLEPHVWRNVAIPVLADGSLSRCTVYEPPVPDLMANERREVPCKRWAYETASVHDSIVSEWNLVCSRRWLLQLSLALYSVSALLCIPLVGAAGDCVGRKPVATTSVAVLLLAGVSCGVAGSFDFFVVARMFVSGASCTVQVALFVLLYEVCDDHHRTLFGLLYNGLGTALLSITSALISTLQLRWQLTQVVLMALTSLLVSVGFVLVESPDWLLATSQRCAAKNAALAMAHANGVPPSSAMVAFDVFVAHWNADQPAQETPFRVTQTQPFRRTVLRHSQVAYLISWFAVVFVLDVVNLHGADVVERTFRSSMPLVVLLGPLYWAVYWSVTLRGRRFTLATLLGLLGATLALEVAAIKFDVDLLVIGTTATNVALATAALSVCLISSAKHFATNVRCLGLCAYYSSGRLGGLVAMLAWNASAVQLRGAAAVLVLLSLVAQVMSPDVVGTDGAQERRNEAERKRTSHESLAPPKPPPTAALARRSSLKKSTTLKKAASKPVSPRSAHVKTSVE
ncbi:solute carrier family 22 member 7-like [Haemaphysalis longicornis]